MISVNGRQGHTRKNLWGNSAYESFVPAPLDQLLPLELSESTAQLVADCRGNLGELNGMARFLPNADMYLTMYVRKEALLSSQIEGTQCTFDDILDPQNKYAQEEVADVVRYVDATDYAVEAMGSLPISKRLLKEVHSRLLHNVRGADKDPGELRHSQNWVGPGGSTIANAPYIPPNPEDMMNALTDLELFINSEVPVDPVIKAALVHYQFETIHPFLDGNGRLGRLLITLCLMEWNVLSRPVFYPSYHLKLRRSEYYERLMDVRLHGNYEGWIDFFCKAMNDAAVDAKASMDRLVKLHNQDSQLIDDTPGIGSANAHRMLELLEGHPIVAVGMVGEQLGVSRATAGKLVDRFCDLGILKQTDESRQRYRSFVYENYLAILREGGEPL